MSNLQSTIMKYVNKGHTYECARLIVRYFVEPQASNKIQSIKFDSTISQSSQDNQNNTIILSINDVFDACFHKREELCGGVRWRQRK
jgi:hypothetical protein